MQELAKHLSSENIPPIPSTVTMYPPSALTIKKKLFIYNNAKLDYKSGIQPDKKDFTLLLKLTTEGHKDLLSLLISQT